MAKGERRTRKSYHSKAQKISHRRLAKNASENSNKGKQKRVMRQKLFKKRKEKRIMIRRAQVYCTEPYSKLEEENIKKPFQRKRY